MKYLLASLCAALTCVASAVEPTTIAYWQDQDVTVDLNTGNYVAEPLPWAYNPTVTVSKLTMHGTVAVSGQMTYQGWGATLNESNYVGFTVTPSAGDTLVLTDLCFRDDPYYFPTGAIFNWGYRVDNGSGFGPWIYAASFEPLPASNSISPLKKWAFASPIVTTGTVEFGLFAAHPQAGYQIGSPVIVLNGTAGDTTSTPATPGVISQYTRCVSFPKPLTREPSALTYNWNTGNLYIVGDENDQIVEISKTGTFVSRMYTTQYNFPGTGYKGDPEGLSYLGRDTEGNDLLMIAAERQNVSMILKYVPNSYNDPDWMRTPATITWGAPVGNVGLEGVSLDVTDGSYWGIQEKTQTLVLHATDVGTPSQAVSRMDLNDVKWRHKITSLSDIYVMANSAAYAGSEHLLLLARDEKRILEVTKTGRVVDVLDISHIGKSTIEGLTMDDAGLIYLCSESSATLGNYGNFHILSAPLNPLEGTRSRQAVLGTSGADEIYGNQGADVLTGGEGADSFVFKTMRDGIDTITDFTPGVDTIDLMGVLKSMNYTGGARGFNPWGQGVIRVIDNAGGALVQIQVSGAYRTLAVLQGVTAAQAGKEDSFRFFVHTRPASN